VNDVQRHFRTEQTAFDAIIVEQVAVPRMTQKAVARVYAMALCSTWPTDWAKVTDAITARWGVKGRERIRKLADRLAQELVTT